MFDIRKFKYINKSLKPIKIVSYNILAPIATESKNNRHLTECPSDCIEWNYRFNLIKKEIKDIDPDIISLQEAQYKMVYQDILPYFNKNGYIGFFRPQEYGWVKKPSDNFGVMILFKKDKFYSLKYGFIDYKNLIRKYLPEHLHSKASKRFSSLVLKLKTRDTDKELFMTTVHLESNPKYEDVKNFQAFVVMQYLNKISEYDKIPVIISGDFNSKPTSAAYKSITTGFSVNKFSDEIANDEKIIYTPRVFSRQLLKSSYFEVFGKEPLHTNYTIDFKFTLDYIFVNSKVKVLAALEELNPKYLKGKKAIPNYDYPSDHFLQASIVEI